MAQDEGTSNGAHRELPDHRKGREDHGSQVQSMFGQVAGRYDLMNLLMTMGQDWQWRRRIHRDSELRAGDEVLDLATGTGQLAFDALRTPGVRVTGADFTDEMLDIARRRPRGGEIDWVHADALDLPFADRSFDVVTHGYLMRNLDDIPRALAEQYRVLRPGGRLVALETSPPTGPLQPLTNLWIETAFPLLGRAFGTDPEAYEYLSATTRGFRTPGEVVTMMLDAGFIDVRVRPFMFGTLTVFAARKPQAG